MQEKIRVFRHRLQLAMKKQGVSQTHLGASLSEKVHRSTVKRWLADPSDAMPNVYQIIEIGELLQVATRWLLGVADSEAHPIWPRADQTALLTAYERLDEKGRAGMLEAIVEAAGAISKARA